jgi:hypothetical protein
MIRLAHTLLLALAAIQVSCIVLPVSRTYFEPNPADGEPIRSSSCGYHLTANDALRRDIQGVQIEVFPSFTDAAFVLHITIPSSGRRAKLSLDKIVVITSPKNEVVKSIRFERPYPGGYYEQIATIYFPALPNDVTEIAIVALSGFITIDGAALELKPFRFKKTEKMDVFYGSINC